MTGANKDIGEFKEITKNYVDWFNNRRISQKTKGMAPCEGYVRIIGVNSK
ncbi:IS3 family transposase [Limosilactobacillus fermentum]